MIIEHSCLGTWGRHVWRDFEKIEEAKDGTEATYYYVYCLSCPEQYHKKGEPPMTYKELPEQVIHI